MSKINIIIEYFRNLREEGVPTINTGTPNGSPGFSSNADSSGPNAGIDSPLGKLDGRSKVMRRMSKYYRELYNKTKRKNK
ncbi:MAG: hypothetical protein ACO3UU_10605 [Minisyncoccia bacterium]